MPPKIFFPAVEAAFAASHGTGFDRLAVDDGRTRIFLAPHLGSHLLAQSGHGPLPGPVEFPETEIMVDRFSVGQIMWHLSPGTAGSQQVQDAIHDVSSRDWLTRRLRPWFWNERGRELPLGIGHIRGIRLSGKLIGHLT